MTHTEKNTEKTPRLSAALMNASILLYIVWLLLPAVQTTGRAVSGVACVALFGLGAVMDWNHVKKNWIALLGRAACAAMAPLFLRLFLERGGSHFAGFYVQNAMLFFPLVYAGYAREKGDQRLWRFVKWALLLAVCITIATTIGWLIQGMMRGGRIYAYSRSLGYAGDVNPAYLKELMLRNIGGYDFVYAMVVAMPFACIGMAHHRGWKRAAFALLLGLQMVMIVLSQYTYAMLYAAAILAVEGIALLIRRVSKGKITLGKSLLLGVLPLVLVILLMQPLAMLASQLCRMLGMNSFAHSFEQLLSVFQGGGEVAADSRLAYYLTALRGFASSPFVGSLFGGEKLLSYHSEIFDLLSGTGLIGTAVFAAMLWLMGRGMLKDAKKSPYFAHICVSLVALVVTASLGTVFYSRDIFCVLCLGTMLVLEGARG